MTTKLLTALIALMVLGSAVALGQEMKKTEKMAPSQEMSSLKTFTCPDPCNFKVQSRDEQEVIDMTMAHAKKHHKMTMSAAEVKAKIKTEKKAEMKPIKEKPKE